jgi:hypothetical protein
VKDRSIRREAPTAPLARAQHTAAPVVQRTATPAVQPAKVKPGATDHFYPDPVPVISAAPVGVEYRVPQPENFAEASKQVFGREVSVEELGALVAAPPDSKVSIYANLAKGYVSVSVDNRAYDSLQMTFKRDDDGKFYAYLDVWEVNPWAGAPRGLGTRMFAKQVEALDAMGCDRVELFGVGPDHSPNPDACGNIAWPLMGFNAPLDVRPETDEHEEQRWFDKVKDRLKDEPELSKASCLNELLMMEGGIAWWKKNAVSGPFTFYLGKGSTCREVLDARMAAKGWIAGEVRPSQ